MVLLAGQIATRRSAWSASGPVEASTSATLASARGRVVCSVALPEKRKVGGSTPPLTTCFMMASWASDLRRYDCAPAPRRGPNGPSLSTCDRQCLLAIACGSGVHQVARVEWSRQSGDEVEAVLGILLCREHPIATRVKASVGDGGIDVWVPEGEAATVYQIKRYTGNITATRKGHIKKSWETLLAYAEENSITLSAWYLVMPENPTKEQLTWFEKLTEDASFPCVWRGLDFVDGLAAKYPDVIDYYFRDGKDRLEETVARLLSIAGLKNPAASPVSSIDSLKELHAALNQFDPHFQYDFLVQTLNADGTCPPPPVTPTAIAYVRQTDNERCITYIIIPRFNEALKERPAPGSMTLAATPGSPLHQQIDDWAQYGTPLQDVPAKNVSWDLPGGFGGSWEDARVTMGASKPLPGAVHETITLRVLEADGSVVASLDFVTEDASSGVDKKGVRSAGHDTEAGLVRYELRMLKDDENQGFVKVPCAV